MKKVSKIILSLIVLILIIWLMPWVYDFMTYNPQRSPFTLYSSDLKEFVYATHSSGKELQRRDESGNIYGEKEFDRVLPQFYVRQLVADERFPDSIAGVPVIAREIQQQNFVFRNIPSSLNAPTVPLYFLLESMSGRVDLQMPQDVFRITDAGIEFIWSNTNTLNQEKSDVFTQAMKDKGFVFPAKLVVNNPSTKKDYDEGCLITDSQGKLFQLKMTVGRPFVKPIALPEGLDIKYLYITEFRGRQSLGLISDRLNNFYAIRSGSCDIVRIDVPSFNPDREVITIFGNLLDWTVQITSSESETFYALDAATLECIRTFSHELEELSFWERSRSYFMPLRLKFTSAYDKWTYPRFNS